MQPRESQFGRNRLFRDIVIFLLENILTICTIGVGIYFFIKSQPSPPPVEQSLGLVFGLLATMVVSDYITKIKYFRKFSNELQKLMEISTVGKSAFVSEIPFKDEILSSKKVSILTNTGHRSIGTSDEVCEQFLKNGGIMNVIMMNPAEDSPATDMAASRSTANFGPGYYRTRIVNTLRELANAQHEADGVGMLTVRVCNFAPSFGIYLFEKDNNQCMIYVRIFAHFDSLNKSPNICISKKTHPDLFNHYSKQFSLVLDRSILIDMNNYRA